MELPPAPIGHPTSPIELPENKPVAPFFPDMRTMLADRAASATTFPPAWHAAHMHAFNGPEARPDPGPPLPEAVQTPTLQSYFAPAEPPDAAAAMSVQELKKALRTGKADENTTKATKQWW
mmetsp:Transcript_41753/g.110303  ORF Transcript_41753/g.110303 Transcript_41753/m.110303 type:complete len:121 (-) Transcript_41753:55-417(-)